MKKDRFERLKRARDPHVHLILPFLHSMRKARILDIGCGLLENLKFLSENGILSYGMDINFDVLNEGKRNFTKAKLVCADAFAMPFKNRSFEGAIMVDIIEHLHQYNVEKFFSELLLLMKSDSYIYLHIPLEGSLAYRLLRIARKIWVRDPDHQRGYKYWEVKKLLKKYPFDIRMEWIERRFRIFKQLDICAVSASFLISLSGVNNENCAY